MEDTTLTSSFPTSNARGYDTKSPAGTLAPWRLQVSANFTAEPLERVLQFWCRKLGIPEQSVSFSPYDQIFQQLLDPSSDSAVGGPGVNFFLLRLEDWARHAADQDRRSVLERNASEWMAAVDAFIARSPRPSLIFLADPSPLLSHEWPTFESRATLTQQVRHHLRSQPSVTLLGPSDLAPWGPLPQAEDLAADRDWHVPFSEAYWTALGTLLMRRARPFLQPPHKVIVVDADNSLWDRVVAEVGAEGIGLGAGRRSLQEFLRQRRQAGMLLALASKNRDADVHAALSRPEMILRRDDFVAWKVNWNPKSENLKDLAAELNLGLDSFVFLDDNPVECAEVSAQCPEVVAVELPADADAAVRLLNHIWALDPPPATTATDRDRTEQYRQQAERRQWRRQTRSFREFIEGLNLSVQFLEPGPEYWDRAAQLTQRTNQFNTTGLRLTPPELRQWLNSPSQGALLVRVTDRFGDYGEVGFVAYQESFDHWRIASFLLSCRVLGKGVEHQVLAELGRRARIAGKSSLVLPWIPTDRNEPAARFLSGIPGIETVDGAYRISVSTAQEVSFAPAEAEAATTPEKPLSKVDDGKGPTVSHRRGAENAPNFAEIARSLQSFDAVQQAIRREFAAGRPVSAGKCRAPTTETETRLVGIWEEVLAIAPVGIADHFLALGGRSIQAVQVLSRIAATWGLRISLNTFFADPRIAPLASEIDRIRIQSPPEACPGSVCQILPPHGSGALSVSQERMWFLDRFIDRKSAYNIVASWRVHGTIDPAAWQAATRAIVKRHEPLRTRIVADEAGRASAQVTNAEPEVRFESAKDEASALQRLHAEAASPFDLTQAPLLRGVVVSTGAHDHWCVLCIHHVAADGWSMGILTREWSEAYAAARRGRAPAWTGLPATYSDFAAGRVAGIADRTLQDDLEYWKSRLAKAPRVLELPTDSPRPSVMTYDGAIVVDALSGHTQAAIERLAASEDATPFVVLLAIFQTLLHRYSGQNDILIGTPVSGRNHPTLEPLVGCFINTVVLRNTVEGKTPFRNHLQQIKPSVWEALAHDSLPFERLVEALKLERNLSHAPLFQVMLVLQNAPSSPLKAEGWRVEPLAVHNGGAKFDLVLEIIPNTDGHGYRLALEYNTGLFRADTAQRLLGHYTCLVAQACAHPDLPLGQLPLMSPTELAEIRSGFSDARALFPHSECLHTGFERQAARTPHAVALSCEGAHLTYAETNRRANQLAHHLVACGVGPDILVGLCVDRSLDMVVAILAVLKAGGAYLPVDASYPADRLAFMLEDARAPVLISQRARIATLPPTPARTVLMDDPEADWSALPDTNPGVDVSPDHLAYVIYTSGSTGKPKGCMITHRNVARLMTATDPWFHFGAKDVWTLFHSCAFDFSVWEIWGALLYGGRLVVVPYLVSRSPEAFYALVASEGVTVLNQTPSAFRQWIQAEETAGPRPLALRYVIFGGEALDMQSLRPWFDRHGDVHPRLVNMYGITETTVHVTYRPLARNDVAKASVIGIPIPDLEFHILDPYGNPVPLGVPGEIHVGGAGVARGYLRREELTAARFVPHPFRPGTPERLYRTGDLARFLPGRDVEYLGRMDQQVKIRGFRIELGEIESVLGQHPAIREAVVIAREDSATEKRLVAYLVRTQDQPEPSAKELRDHLRQTLPDYMVPSAFVFLAKIPLTENGKVDRRALPVPTPQRLAGTPSGSPPANHIERTIAQVCQDLLAADHVDTEDNFFDLGAHSIALVQMHQRLRRELGLEFTLVDIFHHPTIRSLARHLGGTSSVPDAKENPGIDDRARRQREATRKWRGSRPV